MPSTGSHQCKMSRCARHDKEGWCAPLDQDKERVVCFVGRDTLWRLPCPFERNRRCVISSGARNLVRCLAALDMTKRGGVLRSICQGAGGVLRGP